MIVIFFTSNAIAGEWSGKVSANHSLISGAVDSQSGGIAIEAIKINLFNRLTINTRVSYGKAGDIETTNSQEGSLKYDRFLSEKSYIYSSAGLLHDEVANVDIRYLAGLGGGNTLTNQLDVEIGFEAVKEKTKDVFQDAELFLRLAGVYKQDISEFIKFAQNIEVFPNLTESNAYKAGAVTSLTIKMTEKISFETKGIVSYDNKPVTEKKTEVRTESALSYGF